MDSTNPSPRYQITPGPGETVVIASGLRLGAHQTAGVARDAIDRFLEYLESSDPEGYLVMAGDLFEYSEADDYEFSRVLDSNDAVLRALHSISLHIIVLPGNRDGGLFDDIAARELLRSRYGFEVADELIIRYGRDTDLRHIVVRGSSDTVETTPRRRRARAISPYVDQVLSGIGRSTPSLDGADRLEYPQMLSSFIVSRFLYRRALRYLPLGLIPILLALIIKIPFFVALPFFSHVRHSSLLYGGRLVALTLTTVIDVAIVASVSLAVARSVFSSIERTLGSIFFDPEQAIENLPPRELGLISSGRAASLRSEGDRFSASPGIVGSVVRRFPARFGLPDVFLEAANATWIEVEAGAAPHLRLVRTTCAPPLGRWKRLLLRTARQDSSNADVLGSFPGGRDYPIAPVDEIRRNLLVRRIGFIVLVVFGLVELLSAFLPPLRARLHVLTELFPLVVPTYANAVSGVAGVLALVLATGIRRGQRRAWTATLALTVIGAIVNVIRGGELLETIAFIVIAAYLLSTRRAFQTRQADTRNLARSSRILGIAVLVTGLGSLAIVGYEAVIVHRYFPIGTALLATAERFIGLSSTPLPPDLGRFFNPAAFLVGLTMIAAFAFSLVNPYIASITRAIRTSTAPRRNPREILERYSRGTLDYFALRDDKVHYQEGDTLIAYGEYGSTVVISPDPVGPPTSAERVFTRFLARIKAEGKSVAILGAGEDWLPIYQRLGLRAYYIGDEAVVDVVTLTLTGNAKKSLRQAVNRMKKYGYTVQFSDPLDLDDDDRTGVLRVLEQSRRGGVERGFSMTLGRVFEPSDTGLLMSICRDPQGIIVGFCQWVPAPGIGGYSLDIMRRDLGDHPNGLVDLLIVETITYLRDHGFQALSLNFAAMRATLAGERGDGLSQRVERWVLRRLSDSMQIESLWRFNAKFDPRWVGRYLVYDNPEDLPTVALAVARAESLWDIPLVGRFFGSNKPES